MDHRTIILTNVRESLRRTRTELDAMAESAPRDAPGYVHAPQDDLVRQFVAELERLQVRVRRAAGAAAGCQAVVDTLAAAGAGSIVAWDESEIGLPGLDRELAAHRIVRIDPDIRGGAGLPARPTGEGRRDALARLDPAVACLSGADLAIAESGTAILLSGPGRPRLASLVAPVHVLVVHTRRIVRGLGDALTRLRQTHDDTLFDARSNMTLITGPSRTADIELTLTLGVHGPREVHVVLVEPDPEPST